MEGDEAKRLGEKLLAEVEVVDLSSVLKAFRVIRTSDNQSNDEATTTKSSYFNIPELDALIPASQPPVLELISPPPTYQPSGSGKTSLLYLIIAMAILPRTMSSVPLDGHKAAIILFDPLNHFSVARLASIIFHLLKDKLRAANLPLDAPTKHTMKATIKTSLLHLHIFRPPSWPCLLSTLRSLPTYLFDSTKHPSIHRRIHSLILEDTDSLVPSIRNTSSSSNSTTLQGATQALPSASSTLTFQLTKLSTLLSSALILTSRSATPRYYRPLLPSSWPRDTTVTRLALRRVHVRKFAAGISIDEAEAERTKRWEVVSRARFECWKVGMGTQAQGGTGTGSTGSSSSGGFVFRVGAGIEMEEVR